jgi:hypothetical protein
VKGAAFLVLAIGVLAGLSLVVMSLWNWLVPSLFHGPAVQYWQAVGLLLLARILFGGWRGGAWHGHWRQRMWRLRERFQHRCGHHAGPAPGTTAPPAA